MSNQSIDDSEVTTRTAGNISKISARSWLIALGYGFLAGAIAGITFWLMNCLQHLVWGHNSSPFYIFGMILTGGIIIAIIRLKTEKKAQFDGISNKRKKVFFIALSAIVAVGFGGAIGPEAGLIAVVGELSSIIALRLAKNATEERLINETGTIAALSGLYAAPPGSAMLIAEKDDSEVSLTLKIAAGVAGLGGFLFVANWLELGGSGALPLPELAKTSLGVSMLQAILPAILGVIIGIFYVKLTPFFQEILNKIGNIGVQTILGTVIFALLSAVFPLLRFSGHHELTEALELGVEGDAANLLLLGLFKVVALSLCLASGWRGGAIFPLLFAGAAVGAACTALFPSIPLTVAAVAGMSAASMIGLGKPAACFLLLAFLGSMQAPAAMCVGLLMGIMAIRWFGLKAPGH